MPTLSTIKRINGIAGQVAYRVAVTYPNESPSAMTFVGNVSGGPVVMLTERYETFVTEPSRFGTFGPEWVRRFFSGE